ncbi:MAG: hypothetical protein ACR2GW_07875 [Pyrinomonadaceae bacterium]
MTGLLVGFIVRFLDRGATAAGALADFLAGLVVALAAGLGDGRARALLFFAAWTFLAGLFAGVVRALALLAVLDGAGFLAADFLAFGETCAPLVETAFALSALRAGAFSAPERLVIGAGRAGLALTLRFFAGTVEMALRVAGRADSFLTPLMMGSLMHSTQLSK